MSLYLLETITADMICTLNNANLAWLPSRASAKAKGRMLTDVLGDQCNRCMLCNH